MTVDWFLICLREFYFSTQSDDFTRAIAFAWRPFLHMLKFCHFSNNRRFLERVLALNNYIAFVDSFFIRFREFYFLTQNDDFAKAIALTWRPFLPIFKLSQFSNIRNFLKFFFA